MSDAIDLDQIGRGDQIIVRDHNRNVAAGPALFTTNGDLCIHAFGQPVTVARPNRNGRLVYIATGLRVVGHQPPLELV